MFLDRQAAFATHLGQLLLLRLLWPLLSNDLDEFVVFQIVAVGSNEPRDAVVTVVAAVPRAEGFVISHRLGSL